MSILIFLRHIFIAYSEMPLAKEMLCVKLTTSRNLYCIFLIRDVCMYLGQWDASLGPIKQAVLTEKHILQSNIVNSCSGEGGGVVTDYPPPLC